jgi:hypothetical protein
LRYWHKADVLAAPVNVRCRGASWTSVSDCPRSANDPMADTDHHRIDVRAFSGSQSVEAFQLLLGALEIRCTEPLGNHP